MGHAYLDCNIKEPSGLVNPTIVVDLPSGTSPALYNYCYITQFERFYYVDDWTNERGLWVASLTCDVLASWKDYIGSEDLYILRASEDSNGEITDTLYPATTGHTVEDLRIRDLFTHNIDNGTFVVGIISDDPNGLGAVTYYAFEREQFALALARMLESTDWLDIDSVETGLQKAIFNPIQYIASCQWFPFRYTGGTEVRAIRLGWWDNSLLASRMVGGRVEPVTDGSVVLARRIDPTNPLKVERIESIRMSHHPQISRGSYLDYAPYCNMTLIFQPFGVLPLNVGSLRANGADTFELDVITDMCSGVSLLQIYNYNRYESTWDIVDEVSAKVSYDIPIAQISTDFMGALGSASNAVGSAVSGNWLGAGLGIASTIAAAAVPKVGQMGSYTGALSLLRGAPTLTTEYIQIVDEDNEHNGRPLCEVRTPASLGGFMRVERGDVHAPATGAELASIKGYLEAGFYYE